MLNTTQSNITTHRGISPTPTPSTGRWGGTSTGLNLNGFNGSSSGLQGGNNLLQMIMMLLQQLAANRGQISGGGVAPTPTPAAPTPTPATPTPATPTPTPRPGTPVGTGVNAGGWGDPHFIGADGGRYDVQGKVNTYYNLLSDAGFQMNAKFTSHRNAGATIMGEIGAVMGMDKVQFDKEGQLTINGKVMQDGTYATSNGGSVTKKGKVVTLKEEEYTATITAKATNVTKYLDFRVSSKDVAKDGIMPHGIWGQTADGDKKVRTGDTGAGAQGGGVLEKLDGTISKRGDKETVKLYEVGSLFDTSFTNFNRFGGNSGGDVAVHSSANGGADSV
ncbi:VWD domain-containing protein [Thiofilum flexile]|uniref:VWD domain-containing protein n=1 Tax=Thiofilum flexile TaxID=125627 RepID=UPI0009FF4D80|nr:VWD domain-containing protein [Thiofilum flexile]